MFVPITPFAGPQPFNDWFAPDTTQRHVLGLRLEAVDPYWGFGAFVYMKAAGTQEKGSLCYPASGYIATDMPNTALLGYPGFVAMNAMTVGQYGWYQDVGLAIISSGSSVAAGVACGIVAAGQIGTLAISKQLVNYYNTLPGTTTKVITATKRTGSAIIVTSGYDGWFLGAALTGTGVPGSTVVAKLDPDGRTVYMGSVVGTVDKTSTTTDNVSVTATYTGFLVGYINHCFGQGAIT